MGLLSQESAAKPGQGFADGLEFEETFPEPAEPAPVTRSVPPENTFQEHLDRRLLEAETRVRAAIEEMLFEWQTRLERKLDERRREDEAAAERRRVDDEERLRAWRSELETALAARLSERQGTDRAPERMDTRTSFRDAIASAPSARDVGRILRDVVNEVAQTATFALAVHGRDDVAYRYRVAADGDLGTSLRKETLDDGPESAAAHVDGWQRGQRAVRLGGRNVTVHTAQLAVRAGERTVGVVTLQGEGDAIADATLARIADAARACAPRLVALRESGSLRGA